MVVRVAGGLVGALVALTIISGVAPVATAWLLRAVIDALVGDDDVARLVWLALGLAAVGIATPVLPHVIRYAENAMARAVRLYSFDQLFVRVNTRLGGLGTLEQPRFHNRLRLAQESGAAAPGQAVTATLAAGKETLTLIGFVFTLLVLNPWLAAVVVVAALPMLRMELLLGRLRVAAMSTIVHATRRQYFYASLQSEPHMAKEVRLFGLGAFFRARMVSELQRVNDTEHRLDRRELTIQGGLGVLAAAVSSAGLVWAILAAQRGQLSVGDVSVFVAAVAGVQGALASIVGHIRQLQEALLMLDHYQVVMNVEPDLPTPIGVGGPPPLRGEIRLHDVWFRYGPDRPWVLRGVNLVIPAGLAVALVGRNGAGKSTLIKLLCRLYEPVRGRITWDGIDLRQLDPDRLRERIGVVFQDFVEYDLSAAENIAVGDLLALDDRPRLEMAARRAGIHDALAALPDGYETLLTRTFTESSDVDEPETGMLLSGGQGQRLALARALLRDQPDLLILDEPSSGLDAEAEAQIHRELREHRAGRTCVLISHRLNTVREADNIVVLADGKVVEDGDHQTLVEREGLYARLFAMQARGFVNATPSAS